MTPFGARLRVLRAERGMTLKALADDLGVSATYLSALEHGRRGPPPFHVVQGAIRAFNIIWDEADDLRRLADLSDPRVTVDTAGMSPAHTLLANRLAAVIDRLGEPEAEALLADIEARVAKG